MNIYSAEEIKAWDAYTIQHEPIASIDLMERAAKKCTDWLLAQPFQHCSFKIFCGKGNNGGDGLAIARQLYNHSITPEVYILEFGKLGSQDFQANLQRLHELPIAIHFLQSKDLFPPLADNDIIIDALFGYGLNKPLDGLAAMLVTYLNSFENKIISIDLPSGLFADESSRGNIIVEADVTLTFQTYKKAFLVAENADYIGEVNVLDIGLHKNFPEQIPCNQTFVDRDIIKKLFLPRKPFAHKGNFGHALLIGGSYGKMGAMVLCTTACLRSGVGLATAMIPRAGYEILQTSVPEAMIITGDDDRIITGLPTQTGKFSVIGIGPGMGTDPKTQNAVLKILSSFKKPIVIDADGLNCLAIHSQSLASLPPGSILTPHPKEFERLFGELQNDFDRIKRTMQKAAELKIIIILKGHYTFIALPDGTSYFNSTGNAGMAKAGSGDVLTGIITALCAQGYTPANAAILGVYLHGLAGDLAANILSKEAMVAGDITRFLSHAFLEINTY